MIAKIIDGKKIAQKIKTQLKEEIKQISKLKNRNPGLAIIMIGNDPSSRIYISEKQKICKEIGLLVINYDIPLSYDEKKLLNLISQLNDNKYIDGIIIQLPIPSPFNKKKIIATISPNKDVDGFHPYNIGKLYQQKANNNLKPCTPKGIIELLKHYNIKISGLNALIIGYSSIVGQPMSIELIIAGCVVTIINRSTKNIKQYIKQADLLISAIGKAQYIQGSWIKKGAIVIDVGINRLKNGNIVGDVDFEKAIKYASYITPVPGGVGPMTIAMLIKNTLHAYKNNK